MNISESIIRQRIDSIFSLYESNGADEYIGESVTILEHSLQTAQLAEEEGYDNDVILAAFLHDIGHFLPNKNEMNGFGNIAHEFVGANFLYKNGFSNRIALLIKNHVEAKRYLTFKYPEYHEKLSDASKKTLQYQGGIMTKHEAETFERIPLFYLFLKMREWDDKAKEVTTTKPDLDKYKHLAWLHLSEKFT